MMNSKQRRAAADAVEIDTTKTEHPTRSREEVVEAIRSAKAEFHGARGRTRSQILDVKLK